VPGCQADQKKTRRKEEALIRTHVTNGLFVIFHPGGQISDTYELELRYKLLSLFFAAHTHADPGMAETDMYEEGVQGPTHGSEIPYTPYG
jgi:hypothetical protein